jgi:hypothetical protein
LFLFVPWTKYLNAAVYVNIVNLLLLLLEPGERIFNVVVSMLWVAVWEFFDQERNEEVLKAQ